MGTAAVKRLRARLLLATFVLTLGLTGLSPDHLGIIDIACGAVGFAVADRPTAVAPASVADIQHCPVCHFVRAVSGAHMVSAARLAVQDGIACPVAGRILGGSVVDLATQPSRGPPALVRVSAVI